MNNLHNLLADIIPGIENRAVTGFIGQDPDKAAPVLFGKLITNLVAVLLTIATIFALFQLLQGGLGWITSGGDKTALESARDRITNALLGLVIMFAVWAIFLVILRFLGISLIGNDGSFILNLPSLQQ